MSIKQIRLAWGMGAAKGNSPAHRSFPDEMACKTVINRALKLAIGATDDAELYSDEDMVDDAVAADVKHEINTKANQEQIGIEKKNSFEEAEQITNGKEQKSEVIKGTTGNGFHIPDAVEQVVVGKVAQPELNLSKPSFE